MANTRISNLTASASNLASTDLAPVVQTVGVGPVKMTGAQIAAGLLSATTPIGSDPILSRGGSATLQLGAADTTGTIAPTAQFLRVQSWSSSTNNNQTGANFTIQGSRGTGTGAGGSIIFQVAPAGGSSNGVQNAYSTALSIVQDLNTLGPGILLQGNTAQSIGVYAGRMFFGSQFGPVVGISSSGLILAPTAYLSWVASGNAAGGGPELALYRDAANTLALRNGTSAQTFNIYNTYTDASNYERLRIVAQSANNVIIGTQNAGTGVARSLEFQTAGTTRLTIGAAGAITQTAGTLADGANAYSLTATMPASPTATMTGVNWTITTAGSSTFGPVGANLTLSSGYTGTASTSGIIVINSAAGTSIAYAAGGSTTGYRPFGNRCFNTTANASGAGINVGGLSIAASSTTANYGIWGSATFAVNNAWNVGVAGFGLNTGTGTQQIGGFFALYDGGTNAPNLISGALVADNGTTSSPVFLARVNNATAFTVNSTGSALVVGSGGLGYGTGAGGAVTQGTSRTTGVTINKSCGQITLVSAAGTTSWQSFTVSNTTVAATDTIIVNQDSGTDLYQIFVTNVAANSFQITFATTGGTTTEQPVFSFAVIKAVAA